MEISNIIIYNIYVCYKYFKPSYYFIKNNFRETLNSLAFNISSLPPPSKINFLIKVSFGLKTGYMMA